MALNCTLEYCHPHRLGLHSSGGAFVITSKGMGPLVIHISHAYNVCSWPPKRFLEVSPADEVLSDMVWTSELGLPMLKKLYGTSWREAPWTCSTMKVVLDAA